MPNIYLDGKYMEHNPSWHAEDSLWKARQIHSIIERNRLDYKNIAEIGCGAGGVLSELSKLIVADGISFSGYDISPQAIEMARKTKNVKVNFQVQNLLSEDNSIRFDILLVIDVFEHIPDYMGFLERCQSRAEYKIYHIPLDIHLSSVLRNAFIEPRYTIGHIHYFTADSAIATLRDTGHQIVDCFYTDAAFGLFKEHPTLKKTIANVPRWLFSKISLPWTARVFGGYSLLVLAK